MFEINESIDTGNLTEFLNELGWVSDEEVQSVSKAGEGNMNVVLRVRTNQQSFILKQSRPFVNKFPDISAPLERIDTEHQFYRVVTNEKLDGYLPQVKAFSEENHLMMMEDLGDCEDLTSIYRERTMSETEIQQLIDILAEIHSQPVPQDFPDNLDLRNLNHQHIFVLPYLEDNGFQLDDIQPGLQDISTRYKTNSKLKAEIERVGKRYLKSGDVLIHGDYYPGSWMHVGNKLFVLDPEFCFAGFAEFDLGVMMAHLYMATGDDDLMDSIIAKYPLEAQENWIRKVAGIEIMRRIIGLAQLPLERTLEEKNSYLEKAFEFIGV